MMQMETYFPLYGQMSFIHSHIHHVNGKPSVTHSISSSQTFPFCHSEESFVCYFEYFKKNANDISYSPV